MYKFLIGVLVGVILANAWHHYPVVMKERSHVLRVDVSPEEPMKVDPRKTFKKGRVYVIVRFDEDPRVAVIKERMSTKESEFFFSEQESVLDMEPGVAFYLDHTTGEFVILDPTRI